MLLAQEGTKETSSSSLCSIAHRSCEPFICWGPVGGSCLIQEGCWGNWGKYTNIQNHEISRSSSFKFQRLGRNSDLEMTWVFLHCNWNWAPDSSLAQWIVALHLCWPRLQRNFQPEWWFAGCCALAALYITLHHFTSLYIQIMQWLQQLHHRGSGADWCAKQIEFCWVPCSQRFARRICLEWLDRGAEGSSPFEFSYLDYLGFVCEWFSPVTNMSIWRRDEGGPLADYARPHS